MPIKTLVACAAAGAAFGTVATTAYFANRKREQEQRQTLAQARPPPTPAIAPGLPGTPTQITAPTPGTTVAHAATGQPHWVDPAGIMQYGFPGPVNDLRHAPSLVSSFDRRTRNPHWVAEHITPQSLGHPNADRKHSVFVEDMSIPAPFRAKLGDYFRSGYDRGHQVPAADAKWSQLAMDATFALSNMCPQVGDGFNRDYWAHFEDFCRRLTTQFPSVRVVTGPLYLPAKGADGKYRVSYEVIGSPPNVAVPTHFYKMIYAEDDKPGGPVSLGAFVLPNAEIENSRSLKTFEVPVEILERASGLEFQSKLDPSRRKRLCKEIDCEILVKEYNERQKSLTQMAPKR